ncbi:MAG: DUF192 domain-containing protein [Dehalococcoidia bacterium]|nr:DUF192 domain-containing protein [Dehalococcoidia bacterium]
MDTLVLAAGSATITAVVADSFLTRGRGLLARPRLEAGQGLLIRPCNSVHTCFMRQPLDLVGLSRADEGMAEVTWLAQHVRPWRFRWASRRTRDILELPAGEIARSRLMLGDRLRIDRPPEAEA